MSAKSINGRSYASIFFDFAMAIQELRCLLRRWPLSVFLCTWEKMLLLRKIGTAGRPPCEVGPSGGQPQPHFSSKMQTGAPCKGIAQWWGHCRGSFLHCVLSLRDAHTAMEVLTFPSSAGPDILSSVASCKRDKCIHFLSRWENCLTMYGGENGILRGTNQANLLFYPSTIISIPLFK